MTNVKYDNFEVLRLIKPVDRICYFAQAAENKNVLDLGSYDETAYLLKAETSYWLFSVLEKVAKSLTGIDVALPTDELHYKSARILKMDVFETKTKFNCDNIDLITAGELIEHVQNPSEFLAYFKKEFPSKVLVLSTPNGSSFGNVLMAIIKREVQHPDHLQVFTYKILNTLCRNAGFAEWEIIPYRFFATELKLKARNPVKRGMIVLIEKCIRIVEWLFPLLSMGYVVRIKN